MKAIGLRVVIIGHSCSGKSTLGAQLHDLLQIPLYELDAYHWGSNWTPRSRHDFRNDVDHITQQSRWIIVGNYARLISDIVWPRATTMIYLELPLYQLMYNYIARTAYRIRHAIPAHGGNYETVGRQLTRQSLGLHIITTYRYKKQLYRSYMDQPPYSNLTTIYLPGYAKAASLLASLQEHVSEQK